jgi:hypothetical protein
MATKKTYETDYGTTISASMQSLLEYHQALYPTTDRFNGDHVEDAESNLSCYDENDEEYQELLDTYESLKGTEYISFIDFRYGTLYEAEEVSVDSKFHKLLKAAVKPEAHDLIKTMGEDNIFFYVVTARGDLKVYSFYEWKGHCKSESSANFPDDSININIGYLGNAYNCTKHNDVYSEEGIKSVLEDGGYPGINADYMSEFAPQEVLDRINDLSAEGRQRLAEMLLTKIRYYTVRYMMEEDGGINFDINMPEEMAMYADFDAEAFLAEHTVEIDFDVSDEELLEALCNEEFNGSRVRYITDFPNKLAARMLTEEFLTYTLEEGNADIVMRSLDDVPGNPEWVYELANRAIFSEPSSFTKLAKSLQTAELVNAYYFSSGDDFTLNAVEDEFRTEYMVASWVSTLEQIVELQDTDPESYKLSKLKRQISNLNDVPDEFLTQEMVDLYVIADFYYNVSSLADAGFLSDVVAERAIATGKINDLPAEFQNQENWNLYAKLNPKGFDMYYMPPEFMTVKLADIAVLKSSESYHNIRKLLPGFVSKKVMKFIIADIDDDEGYSADDLVAEHTGMFPEIEEALARRQARFDARDQEDAA